MANYIEAELVRIDEELVVTIDGVKYLVLGKLTDPRYKIQYTTKPEVKFTPTAKPKSKPKAKKLTNDQRREIETAILSILKENPNSRSGTIRIALKEKYNITVNSVTVSYSLSRMKKNDLLEVTGYKQTATWSIKKPTFNLSNLGVSVSQ